MRNYLFKKSQVFIILILFTGLLFIPLSNSKINIVEQQIDQIEIYEVSQNNGTLSGFVTDPFMNPIDGALIRVYFHGTYEQTHSDESGYYLVTNIPICYCMKICNCSKVGYINDSVELGITENTTYDFVLNPLSPYPLFNGSQCNGWWNSPVTVSFVFNPEEVAEIWYFYHGWHQYSEPFVIDDEGEIEVLCYWIDFEGGQSPHVSFSLDIDYTQPTVDVQWETYKENGKWILKFIITAEDSISGMDHRLEIYLNDVLQETLHVSWPTVEFELQWSKILKKCTFGFLTSDNACNVVYEKVNGSDIKSVTNSQKLHIKNLYYLLFQQIFERFPNAYLLLQIFSI